MIYDLAIIGAGSAGLSLAAAAAQFGEKVVLFERHEMGGDCLNTGCVPSKALLAAAKKHMPYLEAMEYVQNVISEIAPHDSQERFESLGVKVIRSGASFVSEDEIVADGQRFKARKFVIATGSRAAIPNLDGLSDVPFFTNETLFQNRIKPEHLIIIGGGPIGMEMAQAHIRLGCEVTVLEAFDPMAKDDPELTKVVLDNLKQEGINILAQTKINKIEKSKNKIHITLQNGDVVVGSHILVAAGRKPNIETLNLEAGKIQFTERGIVVDNALRSTNRKVYIAGDAAGGLQFTHVAGYHAGLIIRNSLFKLPIKNVSSHIPWVTYTDPELAQVGLTEAQARKIHGEKISVLRAEFARSDRAITDNKKVGLVKIIVSTKGQILGAGIVGSNAGELIGLWVLAINQKLKISAIANLVLPYPTMNEVSKRAAVSFYAQYPQKAWLRKLLAFLKIFG